MTTWETVRRSGEREGIAEKGSNGGFVEKVGLATPEDRDLGNECP